MSCWARPTLSTLSRVLFVVICVFRSAGMYLIYLSDCLIVNCCLLPIVHCLKLGIYNYYRNIVHGSDSLESAKKEISLWFKDSELTDYKHTAVDWIYE